MAHRIEPLLGSTHALTKQMYDDQIDYAQHYALLLHNLMVTIQEYLLASDDDKQTRAHESSMLEGSTVEGREDNRICIWLEDVWSER